MREMSRVIDIVFGNRDLYEVLVNNKDSHIINLGRREYECSVWKISGLPCVHAFRCIDEIREDYYKYVSPHLIRDYYLITYKEYAKWNEMIIGAWQWATHKKLKNLLVSPRRVREVNKMKNPRWNKVVLLSAQSIWVGA